MDPRSADLLRKAQDDLATGHFKRAGDRLHSLGNRRPDAHEVWALEL